MINEEQYKSLLSDIKHKIKLSQVKIAIAANSQMLLVYWQLGRSILISQQQEGWGAKIIDRLSADLKKEFPAIKGLSPRNLLYMKQFAEDYTVQTLILFKQIEEKLRSTSISQHPVAKLLQSDNENFTVQETTNEATPEDTFLSSIVARVSWSHHIILRQKEPHLGKRLWYMLNSIEHGISRNILAMQIESNLFERQVSKRKINNFEHTLPAPQTDFANYILKDPYIFDFVQAKEKADERDIEEQLTSHITKFLLELGRGFAFIGRQYHFEIGEKDFYADLLFYHTKLHAYIVVELKARPFEPGDASQLNFYVNVVNDKLKTSADNDTIGLLLCKGKDEVVAEYALRGYNNAISISDYELSRVIPQELKSVLPQIEDLEHEIREIDETSNQ